MDIDKLTIGELKQLRCLALGQKTGHSFQEGKKLFVRTVTHYYTGRVEAVTDTDIVLAQAAWIADTGRFSEFLQTGNAKEVEPYPDCVIVSRGAIVDWCYWPHDLPRLVK